MNRVPNLLRLRSAKKFEYLYQLYLIRLTQSSRWDRTLEACRQIRSFAARAGRPRLADFTYYFEIDALCQLGKFSAAWRQLRRLERIALGRNINVNAKSWRSEELDWFCRYHPQILYFLGRNRLARRLYEAMLGKMFRTSRDNSSYELLSYVYNSINQPHYRQQVTLFHIYAALGKTLSEWRDWARFVRELHPKLLILAGVKREKLLRHPGLLRALDEAIQAQQKCRLTAGVSDGHRDLTDPPQKVKRRQQAVLKKMAPLQRAAVEQQKDLESIFPELKALRKY